MLPFLLRIKMSLSKSSAPLLCCSTRFKSKPRVAALFNIWALHFSGRLKWHWFSNVRALLDFLFGPSCTFWEDLDREAWISNTWKCDGWINAKDISKEWQETWARLHAWTLPLTPRNELKLWIWYGFIFQPCNSPKVFSSRDSICAVSKAEVNWKTFDLG